MAYKYLQSESEKYSTQCIGIKLTKVHYEIKPHLPLSVLKEHARKTEKAAKQLHIVKPKPINTLIGSSEEINEYNIQIEEIASRIGQNITDKLINIFYNSIIVSACGAISFKSGIWPSINYFTNELSTTINNEIKFIGSECEYWNVDVLHKIALDRIRMYIHSYVVKAVTEYLQSKEFNVEVKCSYLNSNKDQPKLKFSIHLCAKPKSTSKTAKLGMPTKKK